MTIRNKNLILKMVVGLFLVVFLNSNLLGLIWANYSPIVFCEDCENQSTINNIVIEGGGHFLKAYSDVLNLLNKIELSDLQGIDYKELQNIVDNALSSMNKAKTSYLSLVELAGSTPYIPEVIERLKDFDYDGFQQEHRLNSSIFQGVVYYLNRGDVRGFYARLLGDIEYILQKLNTIKSDIDSETFPIIRNLWEINHEFSNSLLFGQYAAQVFNSIM